jgi:chorismate mutase/prephenate dehydratase
MNRARSPARRGGSNTAETKMSNAGESDARTLEELRERIDAIDAAMHRLLIERGAVIEALIHTKGTSRPGAAFRPGREADMMRRLVARHEGALPLATVEHIWREIISTFTAMQAPFNVAIDTSVEPGRMRDLARFTFGFSVGLDPVASAAEVIARVAQANDLGLVARKATGPWWRELAGPSAPRIMALLPFIRARDRPADLPAFVISPPLSDPTPLEMAAFAVSVTGPFKHIEGGEILASAVEGEATELLVAAPLDQETLAGRIRDAGTVLAAIAPVGGFARGIAVDGGSTLLYEAIGAAGASQ